MMNNSKTEKLKKSAESKTRRADEIMDKVEDKIPKKSGIGPVSWHDHGKPELQRGLGRAKARIAKTKSDMTYRNLDRKEWEAIDSVLDPKEDRADELQERVDEREGTPLEKTVDGIKNLVKGVPRFPRSGRKEDSE